MAIQLKATEQYFPVTSAVYFAVQGGFEPEILKCDHPNEICSFFCSTFVLCCSFYVVLLEFEEKMSNFC